YYTIVTGWANTTPWTVPSYSAAFAITSPLQGATVSGTVPITVTGNWNDPNSCYSCLSIGGVEQNCATTSYSWNTLAQLVESGAGATTPGSKPALNGHQQIQVD